MIDNVIKSLEGNLKAASDPEVIKEITSNLDELKKIKEEIVKKDELITRQAAEVKRLYLNDIGNSTNPPKDDNEPKKAAAPRTLEQIIDDVIKTRKDN